MSTRMIFGDSANYSVQRFVIAGLFCMSLFAEISESFAQSQVSSTKPAIPRIQKVELLNGLRVLAVEKPGETATINVLIKSGNFADPTDKAGLANLTAQSVCFANAKLPLERWKDELEFLNAKIGVRLTTDATVFQAQAPSSNVEAILSLFARLLVRPVFTQEGVDRIKCDLRSSKLGVSEPHEIAQLHLRELVFGQTACARAELGTPESVNAVRIADLEAFHQAHYLPNNTALIVVGGPPMSRLGDLVREKFGSWIKVSLQPTEPPLAPMPARSVVRVIDRKTAADATILLGHSAPTRQTPDFFALTLANTLLGGLEKDSRLEKSLLKHHVPYKTLSSVLELKQSCGWFQVSAQAPLNALPGVFSAILESIEELKTHPVSETELSKAKSALLSKYNNDLTTETGIADHVTTIELFDLARDFLSGFPLRVDQVSAERVQEAAKNYLSSTQISGAIVGDVEIVKAALGEFRSFEISERRELEAKPVNGK